MATQLVCVVYADPNTYGSFTGYVLGLVLRLGGGEPFFGLEPFIDYPGGRYFPFKTFSMLVSGLTIVVVSAAARFLFANGHLHEKWDVLGCNLAHGGRSFLSKEKKDGKDEPDIASCYSSAPSTSSSVEKKPYENLAFQLEETRF